MNKKFSTLVASLLLSSAFSVYAGNAKPMLATPTQVETRATSADVEEAVEWTGTGNKSLSSPNLSGIANKLSGFTNDALLYVVQNTTNGGLVCTANQYVQSDEDGILKANYYAYNNTDAYHRLYWSLIDGRLVNDAGHYFSVTGATEYYEVIPVIDKDDANAPKNLFVLGTRDNNGNLLYVKYEGTGVGFSLTNATDASALEKAALFFSVESQYNFPVSAVDINKELADGFNLFISSLVDESATIVGEDIFEGAKIVAQGTSTDSDEFYQLKKGNKFIVFDQNTDITSDRYTPNGKFDLVDAVKTNQLSYFRVVKADNGSDNIIVEVAGSKEPTTGSIYRLYIANAAGTYALSVSKYPDGVVNPIAENWAATSLDEGNIVNPKQFLTGQFYTIDFKGAVKDAEAYKKDGRLAVRETNKADFVPAKDLYEKAPEAQWAVSAYYNVNNEIAGFILKNRENPSAEVTITELRRVDGQSYYRVSGILSSSTNHGIDLGDYITMTAVTSHDKNDGYRVLTQNELKNTTWNLGQVRKAEGDAEVNVYWTENHTGSHQIGATVEEAKAAKWNLSLVNKFAQNHESETDSILVVSELQEWNSVKSRIDSKKDTLVILPYAFQNRSNNEFVKLNDQVNLDYYICDETNKEDNRYAQRFALKLKADGETYNYVALESFKKGGILPLYQPNGAVFTKDSRYAENKVYQHNSADYGTWKNMTMYAEDANSLMFVEKAAAPEYRKLETSANLDTIKIYRADNEAQVVYEKRDAKSVVDGRTLSFLNIDNDAQFTQINPALYADTAYVNRGNNTRYQYLLGVNIEHTEGYYCPIHGFTEADDCGHAVPVSYNKGRYLINMIDTANVYGKTAGIHNNPYINETEEGRTLSKLSFVDAIHVLTDGVKPEQADKLYVINNGDTTEVALGTESLNTVKFAFKYIDSMESSDFKIQTLYVPYNAAAYATGSTSDPLKNTSEEGYLRWVNGCLVVDSDYTKGDVFNMDENETRTPTANEEISAEAASVVVAGTNGAVVVKGAEGKNVIVSTILGKVVANEVLTSDNAQITAPAGVVVVSVDGESFKVVVK